MSLDFPGDARSPPGPITLGDDEKLLYLQADKNMRLMGGSTLQATWNGGDGLTPGARVTRAFGKYSVPVVTAAEASALTARPGMLVYVTTTNATFTTANKVYVCTAGTTPPSTPATWEEVASS